MWSDTEHWHRNRIFVTFSRETHTKNQQQQAPRMSLAAVIICHNQFINRFVDAESQTYRNGKCICEKKQARESKWVGAINRTPLRSWTWIFRIILFLCSRAHTHGTRYVCAAHMCFCIEKVKWLMMIIPTRKLLQRHWLSMFMIEESDAHLF